MVLYARLGKCCVVASLVASVLWGVHVGSVTAQESSDKTVAVVPFQMNTPKDLFYLQDGIWDMLRSRLSWPGKVRVLDKATVQAVAKTPADVQTPDAARALAHQIKADYVLYGSVTALGESVSLDATVVPTATQEPPKHFPYQSPSLSQLIPTVNRLAEDVNRQIFNRTAHAAATASTAESPSTRHPELLFLESTMPGQAVSYLNPNFIEVTPEGSLRQPGLWRSQTFSEAVLSIDVGDVDGDGREELVALTASRVTVYRRVAQGLQNVAEYRAGKLDSFKWLALADVDGDGRLDILVTNIYQRNRGHHPGFESINVSDTEWEPASLVLKFDAKTKNLTVAAQRLPYFINAVSFPSRGRVALAQARGRYGDLFEPEIFEWRLHDGKFTTTAPVPLPPRCNLINFAVGDFTGDGAVEYAVITADHRLLLVDAAGNRLWRSRQQQFGATTNYLLGKVEDLRYNDVEYYYIPSPVLVMDLNKDGIQEIVVNRSPDTTSRFLPQGLKYYEAGEVVSFSWDQLGLVENWKTRQVDGMVTSIRLGDLNGDGTPELIASLVAGKDLLKLWKTRSTIFSYDLRVGRKGKAETARKP
ncbi:FG-GAP-like repeat-containing protein [Desulfosoma caldarium]|uniref:VCBS repeat protein n=1 Tax=Desulfosoma caldarium TaxID=610254 RepID=A0A3N1VG94_9BACT|nr:FG-GAP-like repeat-containing protein [Desulfosoma caldarium]ROR01854.1 VCBS repeat protein [Desulfosoma caldarium]